MARLLTDDLPTQRDDFTTLQNALHDFMHHSDSESRTGLAKLWHACTKWQAKKISLAPAFTAVSIFLFILPDQRLYSYVRGLII